MANVADKTILSNFHIQFFLSKETYIKIEMIIKQMSEKKVICAHKATLFHDITLLICQCGVLIFHFLQGIFFV